MLKNYTSLRTKFILVYLIFFSILIGTNSYLYYKLNVSRELDHKIQNVDKEIFEIKTLSSQIDQVELLLQNYALKKNEKTKEKYFRLRSVIINQFYKLRDNYKENFQTGLIVHKNYLESEQNQFEKLQNKVDSILNPKKLIQSSQLLTIDNSFVSIKDGLETTVSYYERKKANLLLNKFKSNQKLSEQLVLITALFFIFGVAYLVLWLSRLLLTPLNKIIRATRNMTNGMLDQQITLNSNDELGALSESFNLMAKTLNDSQSNLKLKNTRLEAVINNPQMGMIICHSDQSIDFLNDWAKEKLHDKALNFVVKDAEDTDPIKKIIHYKLNRYLFLIKINESTYECYGSFLDQDSALVVLVDISEKLELESQIKNHIDNLEKIVNQRTNELKDTYKTLADSHEKLKKTDSLKDQFLQNVSHEIRTPLTSIIGYLDIVLGYDDVKPIQKNFLSIAMENSLSLLRIINNLLDLSQIETGQVKLNIETLDIQELAEESFNEFKTISKNKGIALQFDPGSALNIPNNWLFRGDKSKIKQMIYNLLDNAVKFTKEGNIHLQVNDNGKTIGVCVIDTGIGIKDSDIEIIFDKFRQVDSSLSREFEGTGLGLPIVKNIVEIHDGNINVKSEFSRGSKFTVSLPKNI
jgi:signal transduction histidine kinase/HAMP domain-containing protein